MHHGAHVRFLVGESPKPLKQFLKIGCAPYRRLFEFIDFGKNEIHLLF